VTDKFTDWAAATMSGERLEVNVTFDPARGYIASAPELRQPIVALSLASLRKRSHRRPIYRRSPDRQTQPVAYPQVLSEASERPADSPRWFRAPQPQPNTHA
jgi:hypothetical protein